MTPTPSSSCASRTSSRWFDESCRISRSCVMSIVLDSAGRAGAPDDAEPTIELGRSRASLEPRPWQPGQASTTTLPDRSPDDLYILYTGGTTGMPKGVLWRQEDIFLGAMTSLVEPSDPADALEVVVPERAPWLVTSPLMHGNGQWNSLRPLIAGNGVSLWTERRFDPVHVIRQAAADRVQLVVLIGDGMARPFADALRSMRQDGSAPDLSSVAAIASGGAILSPTVKQELERAPAGRAHRRRLRCLRDRRQRIAGRDRRRGSATIPDEAGHGGPRRREPSDGTGYGCHRAPCRGPVTSRSDITRTR